MPITPPLTALGDDAVKKGRYLIIVVLVGLTTVATRIASSSASEGAADPAFAAAQMATTSSSPSRASGAARFVVAPAGNEVRYRAREQLVHVSLPKDAVGETSDVTGTIAIGTDGTVIPGESKVAVDVTTLESDRDRRDDYVQDRLLETDHYPTVTLIPTALRGLGAPLPTSGSKTFELLGNLTMHGVTRPTTWHVAAQFNGNRVSGTAWTAFTFADFGLTQPRVPVVLSVADSIRLEYQFDLIRQS
jgi:polyisoprenoid-binding protein YceI